MSWWYVLHFAQQHHLVPPTKVEQDWTRRIRHVWSNVSSNCVCMCVCRQAEGRADPAAHWVGETGHPETHAADWGPSERNTHTHTNDGPAAGTHTNHTDRHTPTPPQGVHHPTSLSLFVSSSGSEAAKPLTVTRETAGWEEQRGSGTKERERRSERAHECSYCTERRTRWP